MKRLLIPTTVLAVAGFLAACESAPGTAYGTAYDPATDPALAEAPPGSIVYSDAWKPGWSYDEEDGRYYMIVPPR